VIGILDYGVGNIEAFLKIYHSLNMAAIPVRSSSDFDSIDKIILPGVGSFDSAMEKLNNSGLRDTLDEFVINRDLPLLGVCIGMHMLGRSSEEGSMGGLSYISGHTEKISFIDSNITPLLPHMGWNNIITSRQDPIWKDVNLEQGFYFLHSYCFRVEDSEAIIGLSDYGSRFPCAVKSGGVFGFQFHPEKSLTNGIQLLRNFAEFS